MIYNLPYNGVYFIAQYDFLAAPPDTAASNITFSQVTDSTMTVSFTKGSGDKRLVVAHQGSPVNQVPDNSMYYTGNTHFGDGQDLGGGNYSVYMDSGSTINLTGLLPATTYHFAVYEYNGLSNKINFLTSSYATGSQRTTNSLTTIISPANKETRMTVYPNPSSGYFNTQFELTDNATVEITLTDISGRELKTSLYNSLSAGTQNIQMNTKELPEGLYLLELKINGVSNTRKVSIIR